MQLPYGFVRHAPLTDEVTADEFDRLVAELTAHRSEIEFREGGAFRNGQALSGLTGIARAMYRRNIRSLLARVDNAANIRAALSLALTGAPEDAEDALEEAGIELNLRFALFAADEARLSLSGSTLTIEGDSPATCSLRKEDYRKAGREVFCREALYRLLYSGIDCVRYSPGAIVPVPVQRARLTSAEAEAPEFAERRTDWRQRRKPHFVREFCVSCGTCLTICLNDAIVFAGGAGPAGGAIERLGIDYERCQSCGLCAAACPGDAYGRKAVVMIRAGDEGTPEMHRVAVEA